MRKNMTTGPQYHYFKTIGMIMTPSNNFTAICCTAQVRRIGALTFEIRPMAVEWMDGVIIIKIVEMRVYTARISVRPECTLYLSVGRGGACSVHVKHVLPIVAVLSARRVERGQQRACLRRAGRRVQVQTSLCFAAVIRAFFKDVVWRNNFRNTK